MFDFWVKSEYLCVSLHYSLFFCSLLNGNYAKLFFLRGKITFHLLSLIVPITLFPSQNACNKAKSHAVVNTLKVAFKWSRVHFHVDIPLNIF